MCDYARTAIKGDFVLMLDADHIVSPDVLERGMYHFYGSDGLANQCGLVQFPWSYYNLEANWLTQCDGLSLDASFVVEQAGRSRSLGFFSFNGTGGIWRTEAIAAGGGWTWDTVTEDLDLSYKAYLHGAYTFVFVEDLPCALELPSSMAAHKSQKWRWTRGFSQVIRKSLWETLTSSIATLELKIECFFHLTCNIQYFLGITSIVLYNVMWLLNLVEKWLMFSMMALIAPHIFVNVISIFKIHSKEKTTWWKRLWRMRFIPLSILLGCGMSLFLSCAFFNGLYSKDATFIRTPKEGVIDPNANEEDDDDDEYMPTESAGSDGSVSRTSDSGRVSSGEGEASAEGGASAVTMSDISLGEPESATPSISGSPVSANNPLEVPKKKKPVSYVADVSLICIPEFLLCIFFGWMACFQYGAYVRYTSTQKEVEVSLAPTILAFFLNITAFSGYALVSLPGIFHITRFDRVILWIKKSCKKMYKGLKRRLGLVSDTKSVSNAVPVHPSGTSWTDNVFQRKELQFKSYSHTNSIYTASPVNQVA